MSPLNVLGTSSSTGISASYLNQLIDQTMTLRRQPLESMKQDRDKLEIQKGIYSDLSGYLSSLKTLAGNLLSGSSSIAGRQATTSDGAYVGITASSTASIGTYTVKNISLAQAQQVRSRQFDYIDHALELSGTFSLGGAAAASASVVAATGEAGKITDVTAADAATGKNQLGTGQYRIEVKDFGSGTTHDWQFRMVDSESQAVSIADASNSNLAVAGWQKWVTNAGTDYDTGRGIKFKMAADPTANKLGPDATTIDWVAKAASVTVQASDTLEGIRDKINAAKYPEGHGLQASIVDRQLMLTATSTGTLHGLGTPLGDVDGLALLGSGTLANGAEGLALFGSSNWLHSLQAATNAQFDVNGITVTRQSNTGLTSVIPGATIDLYKKTTDANTAITLNVADDTSSIKNQISSFIGQFNGVSNYLNAKTGVTKNSDGTYTRGGLAGDTTFSMLRMNLMRDISKRQTGLSSTAPTALQDLGITLETGAATSEQAVQLSLNNSTKLDAALRDNRAGVLELINSVMTSVQDRVGAFTGTDGILTRSAASFDSQIKYANSRITSKEEQLTGEESLLTLRYGRLLSQLAQAQNDQYETSIYLAYNQLG